MTSEKASIVTYNTKKEHFESMYERNQFYRGLFGYTQKVRKNGKTYEYEKDGLMDEIPNIRIDDSVFIISKQHKNKVKEYFQEWGDQKISHHIFTVIIEDQTILQQLKSETANESTKQQ